MQVLRRFKRLPYGGIRSGCFWMPQKVSVPFWHGNASAI